MPLENLNNALVVTSIIQPAQAFVDSAQAFFRDPGATLLNLQGNQIAEIDGTIVSDWATSVATENGSTAVNIDFGETGGIGNALSQTSVDNILDALQNAGSHGELDNSSLVLAGGTNSTPSAAGLIKKADLVTNHGWTITNN